MPPNFNRSRRVVAARILRSAVLTLGAAAPRELLAESPPPDHAGVAWCLGCRTRLLLYGLNPAGIGVGGSLNLGAGQTASCLERCDFA